MKTIKNLKAEEIRKSILQLAIQGKLVKQDPNDEPASELVKRIYAEKQRLIKEGKIKKDKNESFIFKGDDNCYYEKIGNNAPVKLEDLPFDIPDSWTWIRLKYFSDLNGGYAFKSEKFCNSGIRVIRISDFDEKGLKNKDIKRYPYSSDLDSYRIIPQDVLLCMTGGTVGKSAYIKAIDEECYINQRVALIRIKNINVDYFYSVLTSSYISNVINASKTSTNDNISMKLIEDFLIPLPPIDEELRIVDKINSFEPLIDQYSIAEEKLSVLEEEFPEKLKKSILQYAIEGKLVKQDPNDEPASVLLERIKAEKERLIKEGKIKRDKNESFIYQGDDKNYYEKKGGCITKLDDEFILSLPQNIGKQRFKTVLDVRDGTHESPSYYPSGYPFISSKNLNNGKIDYENIKYISKDDFDKYNIRSNAEENDILFGMIGTIGNPAIIKNPPFKFAFKNMALIKLNKKYFYPEFVYYYLLWIERKFRQEATGGIQQFISLDYIRNSIIPIPSLKYQIKVVKLIDAILSL